MGHDPDVELFRSRLSRLDEQLSDFLPNDRARSGFLTEKIQKNQYYIYAAIVVGTFIIFFILAYCFHVKFLTETNQSPADSLTKNGKKQKKEVGKEERGKEESKKSGKKMRTSSMSSTPSTTQVSMGKVIKWSLVTSLVLCLGLFFYLRRQKS